MSWDSLLCNNSASKGSIFSFVKYTALHLAPAYHPLSYHPSSLLITPALAILLLSHPYLVPTSKSLLFPFQGIGFPCLFTRLPSYQN